MQQKASLDATTSHNLYPLQGLPTGCLLHVPGQNCDAYVTYALHTHTHSRDYCLTCAYDFGLSPALRYEKTTRHTRAPSSFLALTAPHLHRAFHRNTPHSRPAYSVYHRLSAVVRPALTLSLNLWLSLRTNP
ncbi:unnamed protein product, partial [Ectocarpus sp. 13 AM-2016]